MDNYFFEQMRNILGADYDKFREAFDTKPRHKALRVNTLKIATDEFAAVFGKPLRQNPLCAQSFYCDVKPSLDPLYHAGLYYMQEPSASAAVAAFAPYIGERVLDLCAAPGGKSTQAAQSKPRIIFCNDVEQKRVRALIDNIERLGVANAVVTRNTAADYIAAGFGGFFDTLIVDAPCSGGGMMRYETVPYSRDIVAGCAARQRVILKDAVKLLADGGYMLYSTCTFSREENEENVEFLCSLGMTVVETPLSEHAERGIGVPQARRIYPHNFDGEGHFYCVLQNTRGESCEKTMRRGKRGSARVGGLTVETVEFNGRQSLAFDVPEPNGLNVVRAGVPIFDGDSPSYALAHALSRSQAELAGVVELGGLAEKYICGEQLQSDVPRGFKIATVNGHALGWVKSAAAGDGAGALKNLYPKYLRCRA